jgi:hypothetical protein
VTATIETARVLDTAKVTRVMQQFDRPEDPEWCGWQVHRSTQDPGHVLVTCDVPDSWARTMPGDATRQGIVQHLMRYADSLREAGFGTAMWERDGQPRVLIVATDQPVADEIAPGIRAHLTELNPKADVMGGAR